MLCIFVRGKIASGKTFVANSIQEIDGNIQILDPDLIDITNNKFKKFRSVSHKNPDLKVKKYCFLFHKAVGLLRQSNKVAWTQPWSRKNELLLTIRNFGYYFTNFKERVWHADISEIIDCLPIRLAIVQVNISNETVLERCRSREINNNYEIEKIRKHSLMFQEIELPIHKLTVSGKENPIILKETLSAFIENLEQ